MPSRVKLLDAGIAGSTGTPFKIGMGAPPYVIRVVGGYTNGSGAAGTNGVSIETSPDFKAPVDINNPFPTAMQIASANWNREIGHVGGENETETELGELKDLHDKAIAYITHYALWIRAKLGANAVGTATVYLEMNR
jgi:hypothetical protein